MPKAKMDELKRNRWLIALGPDFKRRVHIRGAVAAGDVDGPRFDDPPMPEPVVLPPAPAKGKGKKAKKAAAGNDSDSSDASAAAKRRKRAANGGGADDGDSDDSDSMPGLVPIEDLSSAAGKTKATPAAAASKAKPKAAATPAPAKAKKSKVVIEDDVDDLPDDMPGLIVRADRS